MIERKKLLIIYPNWVPSNAVGVQRVRLLVNFLKDFGWEPIIIAVDPAYYEEEKSEDLVKLVNNDIRVEFVDAKKAYKLRLYGDIALRAFGNLKKKAIDVIKKEKIDCIWTPIPPFYTAIIARQVHDATGVPYVIDYIDPWVHAFPGSHNFFSRAKLASLIANLLEPIAVRKAAGLTGVSESYFLPVLERNKHLHNIPFKGMPYGFDENDYKVKPSNQKLLWSEDRNIIPYVYAGAFLPNAHYFITRLFEVIARFKEKGILDSRIRFYFVGTGKTNLKSIEDYAAQYHLNDIVIEKKTRIPYLEVLNNLSNAAGIFAIGSTEKHYTASKIFQSILSKKPVFTVFHNESTVINILRDTNTNTYLTEYRKEENEEQFKEKLTNSFSAFLSLSKGWNPKIINLENYSAKISAKALVELLNQVLSRNGK